MKYKYCGVAVLAAIFVANTSYQAAPGCNARNVPISRLELIEILRRDGVLVTFEVQDEFNRIGEIQTGKSCFVIFLYTKEYKAGPTSNPHFMARLLILRDYKYLGSYQLDSENLPTRIIGSTIEFPGMERGRNVIVFSESGPPKEVWLHGEIRTFVKKKRRADQGKHQGHKIDHV
jgi:hypothetical protein